MTRTVPGPRQTDATVPANRQPQLPGCGRRRPAGAPVAYRRCPSLSHSVYLAACICHGPSHVLGLTVCLSPCLPQPRSFLQVSESRSLRLPAPSRRATEIFRVGVGGGRKRGEAKVLEVDILGICLHEGQIDWYLCHCPLVLLDFLLNQPGQPPAAPGRLERRACSCCRCQLNL